MNEIVAIDVTFFFDSARLTRKETNSCLSSRDWWPSLWPFGVICVEQRAKRDLSRCAN
jgi:hypothetical protein